VRIVPPKDNGTIHPLPFQAEAIARAIAADARPEPFAFFGHGVGAVLAYEVARLLAERGQRQPLHLFVSGAAAPHLYFAPNASLLGDDKIVDVLDVIDHPRASELRQSPSLRRELLPGIRRDFQK